MFSVNFSFSTLETRQQGAFSWTSQIHLLKSSSAFFFSFHLESVAVFHVLMAIHLVACPLSPHGLTHHHGFSDQCLSKWPPFIASVLIAFHACQILPHGWPTNPLILSHLNQNLLVLPRTDSSFSLSLIPHVEFNPLILAVLSKYLGHVLVASWAEFCICLVPRVGCPYWQKGEVHFWFVTWVNYILDFKFSEKKIF